MRETIRERGGLALIAAAVAAGGLLVLRASLRIPEGSGYAAVGPRVFPLIVSAGVLLLGLALLARVTVWPDRELLGRAAAEARATHWPAPLLLCALLLVYALVLAPMGFVLATAPFFAAVAWVLDDRRPARALGLGLVVALVTYLAFTRLLGIALPPGPLDGLL